MTIIDGGEANTVAAYHPAARKLVVVTMNYGTAQNITYHFTNFYQAAGPVRRWMTTAGAGVRYASYSGPAMSNKTFQSFFPTNTIQTFEIQNVDQYSPPQIAISQTLSDGQIEITWPATAAGYSLYSAGSLVDPVQWQRVTNAPATDAGNFHLTLPARAATPQFFRLANP
jgi:hypothetical protein